MIRRFIAAFLLLTSAGCAPALAPTPIPTQALIPPTATEPPSPVPPTPEATDTSPAAGLGLLVPASAQPLLERASDHLAGHLGVDSADVTLIQIDEMAWSEANPGCAGDAPVAPGFRFVLRVAEQDYEYHGDSSGQVWLCDETGAAVAGDAGASTVNDPIAADMVALAQRRVATTLDLPTVRIRLVEITPVTWDDTSLGCPQEGVSYRTQVIDGYRIVLTAGENEYIFHSDFDRLVPCAPDAEVLPGEATPEATDDR